MGQIALRRNVEHEARQRHDRARRRDRATDRFLVKEIEIPLSLYEELKHDAEQERVSMAEILRRLVADGRTMQEWHAYLDRELRALHREIHELRTAMEKKLPPLSPPAMDEDTPRTG